ncbi:MAG: DUF4339 domain-containing protein [Planctomycetes bacterium]|nr:DUF4339 domain-containing protein [Planctomycetota bacterium]
MRPAKWVLAIAVLAIGAGKVVQAADGGRTEGFDITIPATATAQELNYQYNFWVLEVHLKSLRMIQVPLPDPKTGTVRKELVWYLPYKVIRRPLADDESKADLEPANRFDPEPTPPIFAPEFLLVTEDNDAQKRYPDQIIPQAQAAIIKRERRELKNSVEIIGPLPPVTPPGAEKENALYGVAMWRGIDPDTDYFTIYLMGFSNGYKYVRGPVSYEQLKQLAADGQLTMSDQVWDTKSDWIGAGEVENLFDESKPPPQDAEKTQWFYTVTSDRLATGEPAQIWRRTLRLQYWRPGDRFDQNEFEVRLRGEPTWIYRPDRPVDPALALPEPKTGQ